LIRAILTCLSNEAAHEKTHKDTGNFLVFRCTSFSSWVLTGCAAYREVVGVFIAFFVRRFGGEHVKIARIRNVHVETRSTAEIDGVLVVTSRDHNGYDQQLT
jgi:hypothetical protein